MDVPPASEPGGGPVLQASDAVVLAFQSANDRQPSPLERELLGELERDFATAAKRAGASGADWVVEAIREAVNSGSRFVAPKRVREILSRWSSSKGRQLRPGGKQTEVAAGRSPQRRRDGDEIGAAWRAILSELERSSHWEELGDVLAESVLLGEENGRIRIGLARHEISDRLEHDIRQAIEHRFVTRLKRSVEVGVESTVPESDHPAGTPEGEGGESGATLPEPNPTAASSAPRFPVVEGLTNHQVWAAAREELRGRISSANFETWIRPAFLIGRDDDGRLILGVPNRFAQQRVESKLTRDIESVLGSIVGQPVEVKVVVGQQWLREQARH